MMMGVRSNKTAPNTTSSNSNNTNNTNNKPKVKEINGDLWQLDQNGNPVKKVKKKVKNGAGDGASSGGGVHSPKKGNNVKELDGALWECNESGSPVKKLRRKSSSDGGSALSPQAASKSGSQQAPIRGRPSRGDLDGSRHQNHHHSSHNKPPPRSGSQGPGGDGRSRSRSSDRRRSSSKDPHQSDGRPTDRRGRTKAQHQEQQKHPPKLPPSSSSAAGSGSGPTEYIDEKGRRVVIDADGTKSVFDKNGKKLRPKKKPATSGGGGGNMADVGNASYYDMSFSGIDLDGSDEFADVWGGGGGKAVKALASSNTAMPLQPPSSDDHIHLRELQKQLEEAQQEISRIAEERERERAKNVKATSQVFQLKAEHQRAEEERQKLDLQVKNFEARLDEKERKLQEMRTSTTRGSIGGGDHLVSQIADLMAENDALVDKLKKEKALAAHELKKKEEELRFMQQELAQMRAENDMLFRGHIADKDPVVDKLYKEKRALEETLNEKIQSLELKVVTLQEKNGSLKNDLEKATLEIKDDDDADVRKAKKMAKAMKEGKAKNTADANRASMWILNSLAASGRKTG